MVFCIAKNILEYEKGVKVRDKVNKRDILFIVTVGGTKLFSIVSATL